MTSPASVHTGDLGPPPSSGPGFFKSESLEMALSVLQKQSSLDGLIGNTTPLHIGGMGGTLGGGGGSMPMAYQHPDESKVYFILVGDASATNSDR